MYARVIRLQVQPNKLDKAIQIFNESIGPAAQEQAGFKGLQVLVDRYSGSVISVSTWETQADLEAGESSGYVAAQLAKFGDVFVPGSLPARETYEVGVLVSEPTS